MGWNDELGPFLKNCGCHEQYADMVMFMCDESMDNHWIECDFCGNKTAKYSSIDNAAFKWNEFQYKRCNHQPQG